MRAYHSLQLLLCITAVQGFQTAFVLQKLSLRPWLSTTALGMARGPPSPRRGPPLVKEVLPPMNEEITAPEVRVVTPSPGGKDISLGILSRLEAMEKAKELGGLDLIMINDKSDPPVCKIVDYSKYRYMLEKKAKEVKKNSKSSELKEVKMTYKIDVHDYDVRVKSAARFIKQGNRVKATVMFRGREVQHDRLGFELLDKLAADLAELGTPVGKTKREGKNLALVLGPRAEVLKAVNEERKNQDKAKKLKKKQALEERFAGKTDAGSLSEDDEDDEDAESSLEDLLKDDDDYSDDDDDDDDDASLDRLLGSEELIDELFSKK